MTRAIALLGTASLLALSACGDKDTDHTHETAWPGDDTADDTRDTVAGDTGDTGGCGTYTGSTYIGVDETLCANPEAEWSPAEPVVWGCDNVSHWLDVFTVGWTGGADVLFYQTGITNGWDESHPISSYDYDANGWWDNLYLEVDIVSSPSDVVDGQTTLYECSTARTDSLTAQLVIYDTNNAEVDCAVWGHDPSFPGGNCTDISSWF